MYMRKNYQNFSSLSRQIFYNKKRDKLNLNVYKNDKVIEKNQVCVEKKECVDICDHIKILPRDLIRKILNYLPFWKRYRYSVCQISVKYRYLNGVNDRYIEISRLNPKEVNSVLKIKNSDFPDVGVYQYTDLSQNQVIWLTIKINHFNFVKSLFDKFELTSFLEIYSVIKPVFYVENKVKCGKIIHDFGYCQDHRLNSIKLEDFVFIIRLPKVNLLLSEKK